MKMKQCYLMTMGKSINKSIEDYTGNTDTINRELRDGKRTQHSLKKLTKLPTKHDFHTYRGTDHINPSDLKKGQILHDKAFTSTSLDSREAKSLGGVTNKKGTLFKNTCKTWN